MVKNLPAAQETQEMSIRSLGWENPLEEEMATHSGILAGKIPWIEGQRMLMGYSPRIAKSWTGLSMPSLIIILICVEI